MSAAFDTDNHNILIQRLSHPFGIKDRAFSWLESYLMDVYNPSILSRKETPPRPVTCGCSIRGSARSHLFYIIYGRCGENNRCAQPPRPLHVCMCLCVC